MSAGVKSEHPKVQVGIYWSPDAGAGLYNGAALLAAAGLLRQRSAVLPWAFVASVLRHFASAYGQSPHDYLHSLGVVLARVLLETTCASVDQVARMCAYPDAGTFRRMFRRLTREMPAGYRERYRLRTSRQRWSGPGKQAINAAWPSPVPT